MFALIPQEICFFGFRKNGEPIPLFLSQMSMITLLLLLADGLRVGELTSELQEN